MWKLAALVVVVAIATGSAGAAEPVQTRAAALLELQAAIADEQRALASLRKDPPRWDTAYLQLGTARDRLSHVRRFLSGVPGAAAAEKAVNDALREDVRARDAVGRDELGNAIALIERTLAKKRSALPAVRVAKPAPAVAQCSDGKDNDGDGITDWKLEPGCTSSRDVRESTRFDCALTTSIQSGRLAVTGSCTGAFSEFDVTLLDSVLNGRYDVKHAPSCGATTPTGFRCSAKDGQQNAQHLVDVRMTTTSTLRKQRVRLRLFDTRRRRIASLTLPR